MIKNLRPKVDDECEDVLDDDGVEDAGLVARQDGQAAQDLLVGHPGFPHLLPVPVAALG